ncbi:MAG TPA: flagellar biosynthesis protein FliQ [Alcaligenaceae bacterium]|nr:flagellar biosynthesis protein FliQ [Alcaligenaceae bacterium]
MTPDTVMSMTHIALRVALSMAGPLLITALIIGLVVSIFQAATQINEMTLSFIPKLLGVAAVLVLLGPWLITTMVDYMRTILTQIPTLVM